MTIGTLSFSINYFNSTMKPYSVFFKVMLGDTVKNSELFQNSKKKKEEERTDACHCQ
jgi:hypothetical protein